VRDGRRAVEGAQIDARPSHFGRKRRAVELVREARGKIRGALVLLLRHLGADIESLSGTRIRVKLNGAEGILHRPHGGNSLGRQDIQHVREYLAHARITPSLYENRKP